MKKLTDKQQHIFNTINNLVLENKKVPSCAEIRAAVGGSYSTIVAVLKIWREQDEKVKAVSVDIPQSVFDAAQSIVPTVWAAATEITNQTIQKNNLECQNRIDESEAERDQALTDIDNLESENEKLKSELEALKNKYDDLDKNHKSAISELSAASKTEKAASTKLIKVEAKLEQLTSSYESLLESVKLKY